MPPLFRWLAQRPGNAAASEWASLKSPWQTRSSIAPVFHHHDPLGPDRYGRFVRDDHDRSLLFLAQLAEQAADGLPADRVEAARRFIGQQKCRMR